MRIRELAFLGALAMAACTMAQVQQVSADVQTGCAILVATSGQITASLKGGALNTATGLNDSYVTPACGTLTAMARLSADPTSAEWLASMTQIFKTLGG